MPGWGFAIHRGFRWCLALEEEAGCSNLHLVPVIWSHSLFSVTSQDESHPSNASIFFLWVQQLFLLLLKRNYDIVLEIWSPDYLDIFLNHPTWVSQFQGNTIFSQLSPRLKTGGFIYPTSPGLETNSPWLFQSVWFPAYHATSVCLKGSYVQCNWSLRTVSCLRPNKHVMFRQPGARPPFWDIIKSTIKAEAQDSSCPKKVRGKLHDHYWNTTTTCISASPSHPRHMRDPFSFLEMICNLQHYWTQQFFCFTCVFFQI